MGVQPRARTQTHAVYLIDSRARIIIIPLYFLYSAGLRSLLARARGALGGEGAGSEMCPHRTLQIRSLFLSLQRALPFDT